MKRWLEKFVLILSILIFLTSCSPSGTSATLEVFPVDVFTIQFVDDTNTEIQGLDINIYIQSCGVVNKNDKSDIYGTITITNMRCTKPLPIHDVIITMGGKGYSRQSQTVTLNQDNERILVRPNKGSGQPALPSAPIAPTPAPIDTLTHPVPTTTSAPTFTVSIPSATPTSEPALPKQPSSSTKHLAFASDRSGISQIYLTDLNGTFKTVQITNNTGGACQPTWSPNGDELLYISPCQTKDRDNEYSQTVIYKISVPKNPSEIVANTGDIFINVRGGAYEPSWSPSGIIYTGKQNGKRQIYYIPDPQNPSNYQLLSPEVAEDFWGSFSYDGTMIIFARTVTGISGINHLVFWAPLVGKLPTNLTYNQIVNETIFINHQPQSLGNILEPDWKPGNQLICFIRGNQIWTVNWSKNPSENVGTERQLTDFEGLGTTNDPDWSSDSNYIAFSDDDNKAVYDIWYVYASGSGETKFLASTEEFSEFHPAWRP